jgi:hypothetical protein
MYEYNNCYAKQQVEQSEDYARRKAIEDLEVRWRKSFMEENTWVLNLTNVSNRTADFVLQCYQTNGNHKSFRMAITPGQTKKLGFLKGWQGNFVTGEYCKAVFNDETLWTIKNEN